MSINSLIGRTLSYSAGRTNLDPLRFRVIQPRNKLASVLEVFPNIRGLLTSSAPLVVNAYPAAIGELPQAALVDSYLRQATVSRALEFAAREHTTAILIAQPLAAAHFLATHRRHGRALPDRLLVVVGGYPCPRSLQQFLEGLVDGVSTSLLVHMYGVAEVDAGIFAGVQRNIRGDVLYRLVEQTVTPVIKDGRLAFRFEGNERLFVTDDYAELTDDAVVIRNDANRVAPDVLDVLETWSTDQWSRRTGYLAYANAEYVFQLRENVRAITPDEMEHFDFCRVHGASWLDKPVWSCVPR